MEREYLEEELPFDTGPSEDDDEDFDEFDDDTEEDEVQEDNQISNDFTKKQDNLNKSFMQSSTAFNSGPSWGNNNNNSSPWSQNNQQSSGWNWGSRPANSTPWGNNSGPSWGNNNNNSSPWNTGNTATGNRQELNRRKKVIFCDVLDCLVETFQSNGKPGLLPRGIYDIRLRFEVWDKLSMFSPERIYAMVPLCLLNSSNGSESWKVMLEYITCSLSEYLRLPYLNCQALTQTSIGQPKEEMIKSILIGGTCAIPKEDVVQIGIDSGMYGQNNRDQISAELCNIDYIDLGQLMTLYW